MQLVLLIVVFFLALAAGEWLVATGYRFLGLSNLTDTTVMYFAMGGGFALALAATYVAGNLLEGRSLKQASIPVLVSVTTLVLLAGAALLFFLGFEWLRAFTSGTPPWALVIIVLLLVIIIKKKS